MDNDADAGAVGSVAVSTHRSSVPASLPRRRRPQVAVIAVLALLITGLATPAASSAAAVRVPQGAGGSAYGDPCEATATTDLRRVVVDGLRAPDGTARATPVAVSVELCAALPPDGSLAFRIDLHRLRADGGDHLETPSGWLRLRRDAGAWRAETVIAGSVRATHLVELAPGADVTTTIRTTTDACLLVEAAGGRCDTGRAIAGLPASSLPPLALRACTADSDCGPGWRAERDGTVAEASMAAAGVDYLPEPDHLPVTYPSMCQGAAAATRIASRGGVRPTAARTVDGLPPDPGFATDGPAAPTGQWSLNRVGAPLAWDHTSGEPAVRVAMIDSGVDARHPDLAGAATAVVDLVPGRDGIVARPLDPRGDSDAQGHGTAVASVLAGRSDDVGLLGIAPRVSLLVARVFDAEGCASDAAIAAAMRWAADAGADVISLSLGGPQPAPELATLGQRLRDQGVVLVAAAGNGGGGSADYPAAYDAYLSVTATGFAAAGDPVEDPVTPYASVDAAIDIAAPGGSVSTEPGRGVLVACWRGPTLGHGWCRQTGTSFATPLVAGAAALVRGLDPKRTADGVVDALIDTAHDLVTGPGRGPGRDDGTGAGLLRVDRAVTTIAGRGGQLVTIGEDATPVAAAVSASRAVHGDGSATHAVLARADVLADALAGAPLAGDGGPLLLTDREQLPATVVGELERVLPAGHTVYLMGGPGALSEAFALELAARGWRPVRISGASRVETAVAAARRLQAPRGSDVILASARSWADAVAAGVHAARLEVPLLLVGSEGVEPLLPYLDELTPASIAVIGGSSAVPTQVTDALDARYPGRVRRVAGATRYDTAAAVALAGPGTPTRVVAVGATGPDAAAFGLAAVTLGAALDAPLLLVDDRATAPALRRLLHDHWALRPGRTEATAVVLGRLATVPALEAVTRQRLLELVGG